MIVYVDLNGVLHDREHPLPGKRMGPPIVGAKEAMEAMRNEGHTLIVFTDMTDTQVVRDWLDFYQIPYDQITNIKGKLDVLIDDKALRFESWFKTLTDLWKLEDSQSNW